MRRICGVDVAKEALDVRLGASEQRFANDAEGIDRLAGECRRHRIELVIMEASGGYERQAFALLSTGGIPCAIVNPKRVRDFAKAKGCLEKTDRLDAAILVEFAAAMDIQAQPAPSPAERRLRDYGQRLRQITRLITLNKQFLACTDDPLCRQSIEDALTLLRGQARDFQDKMSAAIADDPVWGRIGETLREVKGVADRSLALLATELPELGTLSNKAIAKLAGLAPMADDSGARHGRRYIRGGRSAIRQTLFIISGVAARFDDKMRAFHLRLLAAGKAKLVARMAVARKFLVILNAKARDARATAGITP